MAKITDYPKTTSVLNDDVFILDGSNGTKGILGKDLSNSLENLWQSTLPVTTDIDGEAFIEFIRNGGNQKIKLSTFDPFEYLDAIYTSICEPTFGSPLRRALWRGAHLGNAVTDDQYARINAGTFKGLFLGDYWTMNDRVWRIVDFDYWLGTGDQGLLTTHHVVVMPDRGLYKQRMNATDSTATGYGTSEMRTSGLNNAITLVNDAFGANHVLLHREYLTNAIVNGHPSGGSYYNCTVEIPTEIMIYGSKIMAAMSDGSVAIVNYDINKSQLAAFSANPKLMNMHGEHYWLRDICSAAYFAYVHSNGVAGSHHGASDASLGVRPVFGIKG